MKEQRRTQKLLSACQNESGHSKKSDGHDRKRGCLFEQQNFHLDARTTTSPPRPICASIAKHLPISSRFNGLEPSCACKHSTATRGSTLPLQECCPLAVFSPLLSRYRTGTEDVSTQVRLKQYPKLTIESAADG